MGPFSIFWGKHDKSLSWRPIETIPDRIKGGQPFLARWKSVWDSDPWEVALVYYGQFGNCFMWTPEDYFASAEGPDDQPQAPEVKPEEWCDIPE